MNLRSLRSLPRILALVLSTLAIILAVSAFAGAQRTKPTSKEAPTLIADKISYLPGETIVFSGGSWTPREGVTIVVKTDSAGIVATIQGSADENGILNISATMPKLSSSGSLNNGGKNQLRSSRLPPSAPREHRSLPSLRTATLPPMPSVSSARKNTGTTG